MIVFYLCIVNKPVRPTVSRLVLTHITLWVIATLMTSWKLITEQNKVKNAQVRNTTLRRKLAFTNYQPISPVVRLFESLMKIPLQLISNHLLCTDQCGFWSCITQMIIAVNTRPRHLNREFLWVLSSWLYTWALELFHTSVFSLTSW